MKRWIKWGAYGLLIGLTIPLIFTIFFFGTEMPSSFGDYLGAFLTFEYLFFFFSTPTLVVFGIILERLVKIKEKTNNPWILIIGLTLMIFLYVYLLQKGYHTFNAFRWG